MPGLEWSLDVQLPQGGPPSHLDAYKSFYSLGDAGNDLALRLHPNGLCVVTLAPSHAALRLGGGAAAAAPPAASLEQDAAAEAPAEDGNGAAQQTTAAAAAAAAAAARDAAGTATAGAAGAEQAAAAQAAQGTARLALGPKLLQAEFRKGRGPLLQPDTVLGRLTAGGREWVLRCGVRGLLVDINARLGETQGAELLRELGRSYLAILDVRAAEAAQLAGRCLSAEQYRERQQQGEQQQQPNEQQPQQHTQGREPA